MSKNVVNIKNQAMAELGGVFDLEDLAGDLTDGVSSGYGILSIRGSKFRIKKGGEERPILNEEGDPVGSLEVVLLKANRGVSKVFYKGSFEEGSHEAPDCSSINGEAPDAGIPSPQAKSCAMCPQNQWGSRITESGKKAKACADSRRVAVVPGNDIPNEIDEGPILLRIPPASLQDLQKYGRLMAQKGFAYNAIATRLGFDLETAYPKLTFRPVRALDEGERDQVIDHFSGGVIERILTDSESMPASPAPAAKAMTPAKQEAVSDEFEIEPEAETPAVDAKAEAAAAKRAKAAATRKATAAKKKAEAAAAAATAEPTADPAPAPATAAAPLEGLDAAMDSLLADMDGPG